MRTRRGDASTTSNVVPSPTGRSPADGALAMTLAWLGAAGGLSLYGQIALTLSLGAIEAPSAAGLSQLTVVTSIVLGVAFQGERFGGWGIVGAFVTATGVIFLAAATVRPTMARAAADAAQRGITELRG